MTTILCLFVAAFLIRMASLYISIRNETLLRANGAIEYGKVNTFILTVSHIAYYTAVLIECINKKPMLNSFSFIGLAVFSFSMIALFTVINALGPIWTVKLIISPQQVVVKSLIFKLFKHPNYFLNVIPELIGVALLCQSFNTLIFGLPLYLIPLIIRIRQEEQIMKTTFADY